MNNNIYFCFFIDGLFVCSFPIMSRFDNCAPSLVFIWFVSFHFLSFLFFHCCCFPGLVILIYRILSIVIIIIIINFTVRITHTHTHILTQARHLNFLFVGSSPFQSYVDKLTPTKKSNKQTHAHLHTNQTQEKSNGKWPNMFEKEHDYTPSIAINVYWSNFTKSERKN